MGKYDRLSDSLASDGRRFIRMSTEDIETVIGSKLPESATLYSSWWGNDYSHSQAKAWMDAGYVISSPEDTRHSGIAQFVKAKIEVENGIVIINPY